MFSKTTIVLEILKNTFQSLSLQMKKTFERNLINSDDDKILFESLINKLFDTGRLNEIELVYSQTSELESNSLF